jgi:two-component system CheB/CheR fusion protein
VTAGQEKVFDVHVVPLDSDGRTLGASITFTDVTIQIDLEEELRRSTRDVETAYEELQSTNEELETTNEELQSTNEELETTNEELQSTNEELETTVEELQAANAELAALNSELEDRGAELARLDGFHRGVVNAMDDGLLVIDRHGVIRTWNHTAERMWGLRSEQVVGRELFTLPLGELVQRARPAFERLLATGQPQQVDPVPYTVPGGVERHAVMRWAPVRDGGGEVVGGVALVVPADGRRA